MPIAIACPDIKVTMIESTGKKAAFLQRVADDLELTNVTVLSDRAETLGRSKNYRERFDVATARAVGAARVILELMMPLVRTGGQVLAMKGKSVESELEDASDAMMILGGGGVELYEALPGLDDDAVIVVIRKDGPTPADYPRAPGMPKQSPL